ncbi:hypothetical protein ACFL1S_09345 [Pseudomonadota bacterium]
MNRGRETVRIWIIGADGGYEIQTYDRILTDDNDLDSRFTRVRNGEVLGTPEAELLRISTDRQETDR